MYASTLPATCSTLLEMLASNAKHELGRVTSERNPSEKERWKDLMQLKRCLGRIKVEGLIPSWVWAKPAKKNGRPKAIFDCVIYAVRRLATKSLI